MRSRFAKIGADVDNLSANFANTGGMVVNNAEHPLIDTNNIADAYEGLAGVFASRRADLDQADNAAKVAELDKNLDLLNTVVGDYDSNWGLVHLNPEYADKIEDRWDDLWDTINRAELTPETKERLHKWGFADAKGNEIPQFTKKGRLDKNGRLAAIVDLARHDVAKRHAARVKERIDEDALATELNEEIEFKLYNMAVADRIVNDATADPEQFNNPDFRAKLIEDLSRDGAVVSDAGYNAQIESDVNATAGWAARVKSKLGTGADKIGGFFSRIFRPISRVDRLANVRVVGGVVDKRAKRIEFFTRILKGFASAFIASALITTIATAAAATAGISLAASMAAIGMVTAIGMGVVQVARWRKAQKKANQPTDIRAFLSDKRLVTSLGVSAIAVVAMCFGAAGMATAATSLGYGALALGGAKNTVETFRDARRSDMSVIESLAWAIANAGAVIAGGFTGRMAANAGINYYNERNPENTLLQNATDRTIEHEVEHTETRSEYTQNALDNAERIAKMWYRNNPEILQQRVDAINAYNAEYGTSIDPYRAIMINGDAGGQTFDNMRLHVNNSHIDPNINDVYSHGNHRVLTDAWGRAYDFSPDELRAAAHLFNSDGSINPDSMDVVARLDNYVYENNTVGYMPGRGVHTDNYLPQNDVARGGEVSPNGKVFSTYSDGTPATVENTYTTTETTYENVTDYNRANGDAMATFGNYNQPVKNDGDLRNRVGGMNSTGFRPLRSSDKRGPIKPIVTVTPNDKDKEEDTAPLSDVPKEVPVVQTKQPEQTEQVVVPEVEQQKDKIFAITRAQGKAWQDLHKNMERVIRKMKNAASSSSKMHELNVQRKDILHDIEQLRNDLGHESDEVIDVAADQAIWRADLRQRMIEMENLMQKRPSDAKGKYAKKDWELNVARVQNKIDQLRNALGDAADESRLYYPTPVPGIQAQKKAARRAEYESHRAEILETPLPKPTSRVKPTQDEIVEDAEFVPEFDLPEYESQFNDDVDLDISNHRVPKLDLGRFKKPKYDISDDEIRVIGGKEKSVFNTPEKPLVRIINEEPRYNERGGLVAVLRRAYDKIKKHVSGRTYKVPESLIDIAENANLISTPITDIRGVPVHLVDLSGNNNPLTQNENRAIVVVDVRGLRIPFYLSNGDEGIMAGRWMPLPEIYRSGKWLRWVFLQNELTEIPEIENISHALNQIIGDVRNYSDDALTAEYNMLGKKGFVGGNDVIEHINPEKVFKLIDHAEYSDQHNHKIFATYDNRLVADGVWLRDYLESLESPEYRKNNERFLSKIFRRGDKATGGK